MSPMTRGCGPRDALGLEDRAGQFHERHRLERHLARRRRARASSAASRSSLTCSGPSDLGEQQAGRAGVGCGLISATARAQRPVDAHEHVGAPGPAARHRLARGLAARVLLAGATLSSRSRMMRVGAALRRLGDEALRRGRHIEHRAIHPSVPLRRSAMAAAGVTSRSPRGYRPCARRAPVRAVRKTPGVADKPRRDVVHRNAAEIACPRRPHRYRVRENAGRRAGRRCSGPAPP